MSSKPPLQGIRVVDFTMVLAGPVATEQLAFLGAEIIRVESRRRPDSIRFSNTRSGQARHLDEINSSPNFNDLNLNKMGIQLNLTQVEAIKLVHRLVQISDIVIDNLRPGVMAKLGLGYEVLRKFNPTLIQVSSSACGSSGPEGSYSSYAATHCALSGLTYITGWPDGPAVPLRAPSDTMRGTTDAFGAMAALIHRQRTGEGQFVDISSREALGSLMGHVLIEYIMNGRSRGRQGNLDDSMAPHNCYPCKGNDKWISIAVGTDEEWRRFRTAIGDPAWTNEARFSSQAGRWEHQEEMDVLIAQWTRGHTHYDAMNILQAAGVAAVPSLTGKELANDPHLQARGQLVEVEHPVLGKQLVFGTPWKLSGTPAAIRRSAPLFGEHNEYVFGELLGLGEPEISRLVEGQVIY